MGSLDDSEEPHQKLIKLRYRIGEVARLAEVEPSVLRYWETEFRTLRPLRTKSGQRQYTQADVRRILQIKRLLHDEHYTTRGAVKKLREAGVEPRSPDDPLLRANGRMTEALAKMRCEIAEWLEGLDLEMESE